MRMSRSHIIVLTVVAATVTGCRFIQRSIPPPVNVAEGPALIYDVPRMDNVVIDGRYNDWGSEGGFRVDLLAPVGVPLKSQSDHDARFRLAWNDRGLLLLVFIRDNVWLEHPKDDWLWRYDGVEVFLAPEPGADDLCQWVISPGMTAEQPAARTQFCEFRQDEALKELPAQMKAARTKTANGCVVEALLPWAALAIEPGIGRQVAFQIWANDVDTDREERRRAAWYPGDNTQFDREQMHTLRLAKQAGPPILINARANYVWPGNFRVSIHAPADKQGQRVTVKQGALTLVEGVLDLDGGRGHADLSVPVGPSEMAISQVDIYVDDKKAAAVSPPSMPDDLLFFRVLDEAEATPGPPISVWPAIEPPPEGQPDVLVVNTDQNSPKLVFAPQPALVEVVLPGGKVVAREETMRGETVRFQTKDWPAGPYEIRTSTATPAGDPLVGHVPWYKGDCLEQVQELYDECDKLPKDSKKEADLVLRMLAETVRDRLEEKPKADDDGEASDTPAGPAEEPEADDSGEESDTPPEPEWPKIHSALMEHRELQAGNAARVRPWGFVRLAWVDEVDGSPQFAKAFLPREYDPKKKWPLVVNLHGYLSFNPPYIRWEGITARSDLIAERYDVIVLRPHGRANTNYLGIGEQDVLRAIRIAKKTFAVDDDRVYLVGYSMGGGGTWHVGTRHPGFFAAIAPVYGGWDYRQWMEEKEQSELTPRRRFEFESWSSFGQAEALLTTPVFVNHGDADDLVEVEGSRFAVKMLQRWGYNVRYWEHPGKGHEFLGSDDEMMRWLLTHRLNRNPKRVRVRSARLKSAKAHWVRIEQRKDPFAFVAADARVLDRHTIRLNTHNVLQARLSPREELVDHGRPVRVFWNGKDVGAFKFEEGGVTLRAEGYTPAALHKTPALEGPIDDVRNTPFAIVMGTISKDPKMRRFCRLRSEAARDGWREWQKVEPRFFLDTEVTQEQIRKYSLQLFGGPDENQVTRELIGDLPLKIEPGRITIGPNSFAVEDAAVSMVYPNPRYPERYVGIVAANSPAGMYWANHLPGHFDFAVDDFRLSRPGEEIPYEKVRIAAGYFDHNWQYDDKYVELGEPAVRANTTARKAPTRLSAASNDNELLLSRLLEASSSGSFNFMMRDLNLEGKPIRLGGKKYASGIAVGVSHEPCTATYDLAGGNWKRLRATIGIEIDKPQELEKKQKEGTRIYFLVFGDGEELYRSPVFRSASKPVKIDVDIAGVKALRLQVANEAVWHNAASSINWANIRLEK